ncbi:MAG: transglutaminase domain-containing protein [Planctomycetota bacterium]
MNTALLCRKLIFTQVLLGIVASCMAERSPGLLLVAGAIGAMSWYVTEGPRGRTIPRWSVNLGALLAMAWLAGEMMGRRVSVVVAMGHFTIVLQLLMLYMRKTDREYTQLLVLSLLQMISASVLSVSMIYGIFLGIYCVVALVTVLLFHLTTAADRVHAANVKAAGVGPRPVRPETQGSLKARRHLIGSTVVFGFVCGTIAAAVFIVMPRTGKSGLDLTGPANGSPRQAGFSNTVQLGTGPIGTGSREPMLNLTLSSHGQPVGHPDEAWLVRGVALDHYNPQNHTWSRSNFAIAQDRVVAVDALDRAGAASVGRRTGLYEAEVALRDVRHRAIFSVVSVPFRRGSSGFVLAGFESDNLYDVSYSPLDQQLRATETVIGGSSYRLAWPITPPRHDPKTERKVSPLDELMRQTKVNPPRSEGTSFSFNNSSVVSPRGEETPEITIQTYSRGWNVETRRIRELAQSVIREAGLERDLQALHTPDDLAIASVLAEYLREHYEYDLVNPVPLRGQDPIVTFLFERRRGHCELFAAGLAAMCRSLGIPARLATGFRASEFNTIGGYYVVRQSNAHAWTEVDGGPGSGWVTFDSTPTASVQAEHRAPEGWLSTLRAAYEHIEFAWIRRVVAFDSRTQEQFLENAYQSIAAIGHRAEAWFGRVRDQVFKLGHRTHFGRLQIVALSIGLLGLGLAAVLLTRSYLNRRRRLARLQLTRLPGDRRRDLGKRLGFYLTMLDILDRHGHRRPDWQSPRDFADQLTREHPLRFDPVVALTELFYDVRFGQRETDAADHQLIQAHLKRLEYTAVNRHE